MDESIQPILEYLEQDYHQRPLAAYNADALNPSAVFSEEESDRLAQLATLHRGEYPKSRVAKLIIDLSWASSALEGNSYSLLDTQALIEYGETNKDKPADHGQMVLNHKSAIEYLLQNLSINRANVMAIHKRLMFAGNFESSQHFLEESQLGVVRSFSESGFEIFGTSYLPPQPEDRGAQYIDEQFERLLSNYALCNGPFNKAFYLATRVPYLQVFYDGNKRSSRIACNGPLIESGLSPISFVDYDKRDYLNSLIAFYELNSELLAKKTFLSAYVKSLLRYKHWGEAVRVHVANSFDQEVEFILEYVATGEVNDGSVVLR